MVNIILYYKIGKNNLAMTFEVKLLKKVNKVLLITGP